MTDIRDIQQKFDRFKRKASDRDMSRFVMELITQVREYVRDIAEQEQLIAQMRTLERDLHKKPETAEDEQRQRELHQLFESAKEAERRKEDMRASIRQLKSAVEQLRSEIKKVR